MQEDQTIAFGKLVALEGDGDTIAIQLRLLPPSQKIFVLPGLDDDVFTRSDNVPFDARAFVRDVHAAFTDCTEAARSFLRASTPEHPRLAFMNGGSVSARMTCISKISEKAADGDLSKAEAIFDDIVKGGVRGLTMQEIVHDEEAEDIGSVQNEMKSNEREDAKDLKEVDSVPVKSSPELNEDIQGLGLSHGYEQFENATSKTSRSPRIGGSSPRTNMLTSQFSDNIVTTGLTVPNRKPILPEKRGTFGPQYERASTITTSSVYSPALSHQTEGDEDDLALLSDEEAFISMPHTPSLDPVVIGEACLVDIQSCSPKKTSRKARSVDRFYPSNCRYQAANPNSALLRTTKSAGVLEKRPRVQSYTRGMSFDSHPRTMFVKASKTTITKSVKSSGSQRSSSSRTTPPLKIFVDRGTDAVASTSPVLAGGGYFAGVEPVFPVVEDLVIKFVDENPKPLFDLVLKSYMSGSFPALVPSTALEPHEPSLSPLTPASAVSVPGLQPAQYGLRPSSSHTDDSGYDRKDDFDPYSPEVYFPKIKNPWQDNEHQPDSAVGMQESATPESTSPTLSGPYIAKKFAELNVNYYSNPITVQNNLRLLLNAHFPAGENGYTQHCYPVAPEADRFWKPVFRNDENSSIGSEGRTLDQIVALGCEIGAKKEFFDQISGQVEKLGIKRDGVSRSGKLDIKYLIANAMQSYYGSNQAAKTSNPLSSPELLAALLVPQLEMYLASNNSTRLLILQYSASDLSLIFALKQLLGSDIFKIAGILDSLASDPPPMSRPRTPLTNPLSNKAVAFRTIHFNSLNSRTNSLSSPKRQVSTSKLNPVSPNNTKQTPTSFSKADYLLPSTATDAEITTFLSSIWKSLMDKSSFYTPEPEPKPIIIERPPVPPTPTSTYSNRSDLRYHDCDSTYPPSSLRGTSSKVSRLTVDNNTSSSSITSPRTPTNYSPTLSSARHQYAPSVVSTRKAYAPSITSTKTGKTTRSDKDKDWENFYIGDEDSEDDEFDKMIMGRNMAKIIPEVRKEGDKGVKRDKKKALKWLGLA